MKKLFLKLKIVEKHRNKGIENIRFNPYNPLSWVVILLAAISVIVYGAIKGMLVTLKEVTSKNPFKWQ